MSEFRKVTDHLSVAPQLVEASLRDAADAGFRTIICNRPDSEDPGAPDMDTMRAGAEALGMVFHALPFAGAPGPDTVTRQGDLIAGSPGPVLAYCRSGTRSITAWALSQANPSNVHEIIKLAEGAGYDLSGLADLM